MEITVQHHLTQAVDFTPFKHKDGPMKGKAIKNMPFWIKLPDAWCFDFIRSDMDMEQFTQNLKAGSVYILKEINQRSE